jgi:predicted PurR-regulated permease PerM
VSESTGKSGWGTLFRGRNRSVAPDVVTPTPATTELTSAEIDRTIPAGVRLAGAWSWRLLLIAAAIAVFGFLIVQLRLIVIPLLIAVLISALLIPVVDFLVKHRWPRGLSVATAMVAALLVVGGLITLATTQIIDGSTGLSARLSTSYSNLKEFLLTSPLHLTDAQISDYMQQIWTALQSDTQIFVSGALSVGSSLGHLLTGVLLALFSLLFILIDGKGIWSWIVRVFPRRARAAVNGAGIAGWATLGNFVKVQILVASIDAVGIGVGAALLGVPMAIPIAVLVFLGSFIPIVGAVATGAVAVVIALIFNGPLIAVIMLGVVLLVQQIEGHVLQPLIMGSAVKVHPLAVVLVVAAGSLVAGIPGALFAVPIAAVLNVMTNYISSGVWRTSPLTPGLVPSSPLWQTVPQSRPTFRRNLEEKNE